MEGRHGEREGNHGGLPLPGAGRVGVGPRAYPPSPVPTLSFPVPTFYMRLPWERQSTYSCFPFTASVIAPPKASAKQMP